MSFPIVTLDSVCEVIAGQSPPSNTYNDNQIGLPFFQGKADFGRLYPITRMWCSEPLKISLPNDILLSVRAPVGPTNLNNSKACIGRGLSAIRCSKKIEKKFLLHYLRFNEQKIADKGTGSTFKAITQKDIKALEIPLPPLAEQQKIAAILDAADSLRQKDQQLVERYTALSQSLFLEMFGDPVTNPMGWNQLNLNNIVSKLGDGLHGTPEYSDDGEYFFINGNNLNHGTIEIYPETKKVSESEFNKHKKELTETTMLVSINGSIGKVAFYNGEKVILGKSACYFNIKESLINRLYLFHLIESPYFLNYAMGSATGSTIKNVSLKTMRELPVPIPPMSMQIQFAEHIQLIEMQKKQAQLSLEKSEALFNSLLQHAFTGELTAKMAA